YTYNARGNVATVTDPLNRTTIYGYLDDDSAMTEDLTGNIRSVKDAASNVTKLVYDAMNRTTRRCNATGNPSLRCIDPQQTGVTQYVYQPVNANCNALTGTMPTSLLWGVKDANAHCTRFDYDNLNRLQTVTNPLGNQRMFQYDPAGNITQVTNARNQSTILGYDIFQQLSSKLVNSTDLTCYYYDAVGNLTDVRAKASGGLCTPMPASFESGLSFQYDLMNRRVQAQTLASTSGQPITTIRYTYDENSNRESAVLTTSSQTLGMAYTY